MWKLFVCFSHNRQRFTKGRVEAKGIVSKFTFAWRLHSNSDTQLLQLPELCCSCAWPCALQASLIGFTSDLPSLWSCLITMDLAGSHWLTVLIITWPAPLLQEVPLLMRPVPLCALRQPLGHSPLRWSHPSLLLTDVYPGILKTSSQERVLRSVGILIFQWKSMLTL